MKKRYYSVVGAILGMLLSMLGISGCGHHTEEVICLYGPPPEEMIEEGDTVE